MRFLNPKTDFAFKKIFGSEESRDVLLSFLNALLGLTHPDQLADVEILDPYLAPKISGMKDTYLDVRARDERGKQYVIEIQVLNVPGFEKRVLYNACKAYSGQIARGDSYGLLQPVIAITITDFPMFSDLGDIVNAFYLRAEAGRIYSEDLVLVFAELPKFTKAEEELESVLDKWFYFLRHAGDLSAVPETLGREPAIAKAFAIANKAGLSQEELDDQERREMFIQDQRGALQLAEERGLERGREEGRERGREEGLERGREEGLEEGIAAGRHDERLQIARNMLGLVPDDELIARATGLTAAHVGRLRGG